MTPKENTLFMLEVYEHFGCSGPITAYQVEEYKSIKFGRLSQQEEETMNDNLNTPTHADDALAPHLNDEDFAKLMATKPLDGGVLGYITDADEEAGDGLADFGQDKTQTTH